MEQSTSSADTFSQKRAKILEIAMQTFIVGKRIALFVISRNCTVGYRLHLNIVFGFGTRHEYAAES